MLREEGGGGGECTRVILGVHDDEDKLDERIEILLHVIIK